MYCSASNRLMSRVDRQLHEKVLDQLGLGKRKAYEDEHGEEVVIVPYAQKLFKHVPHLGLHLGLTAHEPMSSVEANAPRLECFDMALHRALNFALARAVVKAEACETTLAYREKFMDANDVCYDGTRSAQSQAIIFFEKACNALHTEHDAILASFKQATKAQDYIDVFDRMLDLRYTKELRKPCGRPWDVQFVAQFHPSEVEDFEHEDYTKPNEKQTIAWRRNQARIKAYMTQKQNNQATQVDQNRSQADQNESA